MNAISLVSLRLQPETVEAIRSVPEGTVSEAAMARGMRLGEPILVILDGLLRYAKAHRRRFEGPLADDGFLGPQWLAAASWRDHGLCNRPLAHCRISDRAQRRPPGRGGPASEDPRRCRRPDAGGWRLLGGILARRGGEGMLIFRRQRPGSGEASRALGPAECRGKNSMANRERFETILAGHYRELFLSPDYAMAAARTTPEALARKMTAGMITGAANHDGEGIRRTCRDIGIPHTATAIREFLAA